MSVEDSQGNPKPLADAVPCKTRREFIEYGVQQAGWTVLVLALVAAACVWVLPLSLLGMLLVPVLSGPLPLALTFFDVSNEQLLWLTIVVAAGYWGLLGAVAGLAGWNAFAFEWKEQSLETLRQAARTPNAGATFGNALPELEGRGKTASCQRSLYQLKVGVKRALRFSHECGTCAASRRRFWR